MNARQRRKFIRRCLRFVLDGRTERMASTPFFDYIGDLPYASRRVILLKVMTAASARRAGGWT